MGDEGRRQSDISLSEPSTTPPEESLGAAQAGATRPGAVLDGARVAALRDLGLLDTGAEEEFDRYTRLASDLLGVPVSLVSLVDADRQFFKSQHGLTGPFAEAGQTPLSHSFCQHAVSSQQPLVISDAREHSVLAENLAIRDLGVIAYAGMPLVLSNGQSVGAFCAIDGKPREWSEQDIRVLGDLAAAVTAHLEVRKALAEQSLHDRLTGLPNRALLCAQADQLLHSAGLAGADSVGAICIGLDGFGLVNEAHGVVIADGLLQQVADRLAGAVRDGDVLGRFGSDAFAILGKDMGDERATLRLAARLRAAVSDAPFDVNGHSIGVTATLGLASGGTGGSGVDLLAHAHSAMRSGKAGGGAVQTVVAGMRELALAQLRLRGAMGGALARDEFSVVYQPIVDLATGTPVAFEALARWTSPVLGSVGPAEFIPVAERTGEIVRLGEWVLREACAQAAAWRQAGDSEVAISVNLAPLQLELPNLCDIVESVLEEHALAPSALVLEITERMVIGAGALEAQNLARLRELGVNLALDDFGTGYSALGYLSRFPVDELKIDRSFVSRLEDGPREAALVQAILALAEALGVEVVAEGIETEGQRRQLERLGCSLGQGYLFARPLPPEECGNG